MEYPINTKETISIIEYETGETMDPVLRRLWEECVIPIAAEAHDKGIAGRLLEPIDYVGDWKKHLQAEPSAGTMRILNAISKVQKRAYEDGRQDALKEVSA